MPLTTSWVSSPFGDMFTLMTPNGDETQLVVKGIYEPPPFFPILGSVSIIQSLFDSVYDRPQNSFVFVDVPADAAHGASGKRHHRAHRGRARASARDFPRDPHDEGTLAVQHPDRRPGDP